MVGCRTGDCETSSTIITIIIIIIIGERHCRDTAVVEVTGGSTGVAVVGSSSSVWGMCLVVATGRSLVQIDTVMTRSLHA